MKKDIISEALKDLRESKNIPAKELVAEVRQMFKKYDRSLQTKCERSDEYGITLRKEAFEALLKKYDPEAEKKIEYRRTGGHKLTKRVSCRLTDEEYISLMDYIKAEGFDTMQAWLAHHIRAYLRRKDKSGEKNNK